MKKLIITSHNFGNALSPERCKQTTAKIFNQNTMNNARMDKSYNLKILISY